MKRAAIVVVVAVVAGAWFGPWVVSFVLNRHTCSHEPSQKFDADRWARCAGPQRIAMAEGMVARHELVGRTLSDAVSRLGPTEIDKDGDLGWRLGEPDGSPSLYPNAMFLGVLTDRAGSVTTSRVVDELEGPPLHP